MRISIRSLGCPKNFVDSEVICGCLLAKGHTLTNAMEDSDLAVINTCSFIRPAVEESIDVILEAVKLKKEGKLGYIVVAGCLPQRYKQRDLIASLPEIDAFTGIDQITRLDEIIRKLPAKKTLFQVNSHPCFLYDERSPRLIMTPEHSIYLKIAEGCNHRCSYCLIPDIKGHYRSRTMESIVAEAANLIQLYPLKEMILVAEDTTYYGSDLYGKPSLPDLLERLIQLIQKTEQDNREKQGIRIRILYTHPTHFDDRLIDTLAKNSVICPYLDIPLQHISDSILKRMNRRISQKEILLLIGKLREKIPGLTLRTTFIVGFPGETDQDYQELCQFVQQYRFEKAGVFPFYNEEGCPASRLSRHVPEKVKEDRLTRLLKIQKQIALDHQLTEIGKNKFVLIDGISEKNKRILVGRSCAEAPEIDGVIYVSKGTRSDIGKWIDVKITRAHPYDLEGEKIALKTTID